MESIYEEVLFRDLKKKGLDVRRQETFSFVYEGIRFDNALRLDLLVEGMVVLELKSIARLERIHTKQLLSYLRLLHFPIGFLFNFGAPTFKEGIHRMVNNYHPSQPSWLRVKKQG